MCVCVCVRVLARKYVFAQVSVVQGYNTLDTLTHTRYTLDTTHMENSDTPKSVLKL